MQSLLVPVDLTESTRPVLEQAKQLAKATGARVHVLHVAHPESTPARQWAEAEPDSAPTGPFTINREVQVQSLVDDLRRHGVAADGLVEIATSISTEILAQARTQGSDLIVIGNRRCGRESRQPLGRVCRDVVDRAEHPVTLVPVSEARQATHDPTQPPFASETAEPPSPSP